VTAVEVLPMKFWETVVDNGTPTEAREVVEAMAETTRVVETATEVEKGADNVVTVEVVPKDKVCVIALIPL